MIVVGRLMVVRLSALFRLRGQEVKTSPFHGGNTGSIPVGVILKDRPMWLNWQSS